MFLEFKNKKSIFKTKILGYTNNILKHTLNGWNDYPEILKTVQNIIFNLC